MFFWNSLALLMVPTNVGNLISGSSAFSKSKHLKVSVHILLKPGLVNLEHYFASI